MLISARFPSTCAACSRAIEKGDRISYVRGAPALHAACSEEGRTMAARVAESRAAAPSAIPEDVFPCPDGREFLPYQIAGMQIGIRHLRERRGLLLADQMGLGKSAQAIGLVNAMPDVRRVLVVCPDSLKLNWRKELAMWLTREELSFGIFEIKTRKGKKFPTSFDIEIVNYEALSKLPPESTWDLCIFDEMHYAKNEASLRGKRSKAIRRRCKYVVGLTGTPILNKPRELFPLLSIVCPSEWDPKNTYKGKTTEEGEGGGFFKFAFRYCNAHRELVAHNKLVWNFDGSSNLDELQERLRSTCMIRRLKADVLKDLPPKRRVIVPIAAEDQEEDFEIGDDFEEATRRVRTIPFSELSKIRHAHARAKVAPAIEHLKNALESSPNEKIIVFAHHLDVIDDLVRGLASYGVVRIVGEDSLEARDLAVTRFQTDASVRVFVGSLKAAGVGLTLTASAHVVFVEGSWVPADETQAEDRAHRIGQRNSVLVEKLVREGSLDERMARFVTEKQEIADMALDDETIQDVSGRAVVVGGSSADPMANPSPVPTISPEEIARVHADLVFLATRCDGAVKEDGTGFNRLDASFGRALAALPKLSPRQAIAGRKLTVKYRRQLEGRREPLSA